MLYTVSLCCELAKNLIIRSGNQTLVNVMKPIYSNFVFFYPESAYIIGTAGSTDCPAGYKLVTDQTACKGKVKDALLKDFGSAPCHEFAAVGCFALIQNDGTTHKNIYFSTCNKYATIKSYAPICEGTLSFQLSQCHKSLS